MCLGSLPPFGPPGVLMNYFCTYPTLRAPSRRTTGQGPYTIYCYFGRPTRASLRLTLSGRINDASLLPDYRYADRDEPCPYNYYTFKLLHSYPLTLQKYRPSGAIILLPYYTFLLQRCRPSGATTLATSH